MSQSIENIVKNDIYLEGKMLEKIAIGEYTPNMASTTLWKSNVDYAINSFFINEDIKISKSHFNICGLLDGYSIVNYNSRLLDYGLHHISYVLLSDNEPLIQRYAKLRYQKGKNAELSMDEMVLEGESAIWCNTIQFFMSNDNVGVERNLNIIETKTSHMGSKKVWDLMKDDYEFYKALHATDKARIEEILDKLVSPKIHKKRNDNVVLSQYISLPALGYAKLAWRKGIEVEVHSPLVPKELLPIEPLISYEVPYDFL